MAQQVLFLGTNPNDGTGESAHGGGQIINDNFTELYALTSDTINAGAVKYNFAGATNEQRIALADADAVILGKSILFIPASLLPYDVLLCPASAGVQRVREGGDYTSYDALAYGVPTGATDATQQLNALFSAVPAGGVVRGQLGQTYTISGAGTQATSLFLPFGKDNVVLDFGASVIKSNSGFGYDGNGGAGLGLLNIAADTVTFYGTLDCNTEAAYGVALKMWDGTHGTGFRIFGTIKNCNESRNKSWTGISWSLSPNFPNVTVTANYHLATSGFLSRPGCPYKDPSTGTITQHGDTTCQMIGGPTTDTGSPALFAVKGYSKFNYTLTKPDPVGILLYNLHGDDNTHLGDIVCHDAGLNSIENYGTSIANSAQRNLINNDIMGYNAKYAALALWAHANLGSDGTYPSLVIGARAAGQADIDLDYNPVVGAAGGRIIHKLLVPTEATLVSGIDCRSSDFIQLTLTADRVVGAPLNPRKGQELGFFFTQDGTGGWNITWNAAFNIPSWSNQGNIAAATTAVVVVYDGTKWNQLSDQAPYAKAVHHGVLYHDGAHNTTSTSDISMGFFSLPGGTLSAAFQAVRITMRGIVLTQNAVPNIKFGATVLVTGTVTAGNIFEIEAIVDRITGTTQKAIGTLLNGTTLATSRTSPAETLSGAITIDFRGSATSGGTLFYDYGLIELLAA